VAHREPVDHEGDVFGTGGRDTV